MIQTILAYIAVAAAAGWVAWTFLPRRALMAAAKRKSAGKGDCGSGCGCGD